MALFAVYGEPQIGWPIIPTSTLGWESSSTPHQAFQSNAMATRLADRLTGVPGVEITQPVQANVVFARLARAAIAPLQDRYPFYVWDEPRDEVRWMCAWDTPPQEVDGFAAAIRETLD